MLILVAAVVVIGTMATLNLLLTAAVLRRLRTLPQYSQTEGGPDLGAALPEVVGRSTTGELIDTAALPGRPGLIGFFSTDCSACTTYAPRFADAARADAAAGGDAWALAVVLQGPGSADELLRVLSDPVTVLVEEYGGAFLTSFDIAQFPLLLRIGADGHVLAKGDVALIRDHALA